MSSTPPPVPDPAPVTDSVPARSGTVLPFPTRLAPEPDEGSEPDLSDPAPSDADRDDDRDDTGAEHRDWAWVEEWRSGAEPTPWASGLALAAFTALVVGIAIVVLSSGLSANPVIAVVINLLVAAGLVPAIWLSRELPVLRWIGLGAAFGVVGGWIAAIGMLG